MMEELLPIVEKVIAVGKSILGNNWGVFVAVFAALIAHKALKAAFEVVVGIVFVGIILAIATNMGVIPPLGQLIQEVKQLVGF